MSIPAKPRTGRRVSAILVTMFALASSGCWPRGVAWLPDSSGIVYTEKLGSRLVRYDLNAKARTVINGDTKTQTTWPALSPDGKQAAVASREIVTTKGSKNTVEKLVVIFYGSNGKEQKRSSTFQTPGQPRDKEADESGGSIVDSALVWGPNGLILLPGAIYDSTKDRWIRINSAPFPFTNQPVSPNGKGFLATGEKELLFIDWEGWESSFVDSTPDTPPMASGEHMVAFHWDGHVAKISEVDRVHEFDTITMKHDVKPRRLVTLPTNGKLEWVQRFRGDALQLCIHKHEAADGKPEAWSLEIQDPTSRKRKVVFRPGEASLSGGAFRVFPSPDGSRIAVVADVQDEGETIVVIDETGKIEARITLEK